jgi:hypothetical protein
MLRLLADENVDGDLIDAVRLGHPSVDFIRVQDVGLRSAQDAAILECATSHRRLLVTHDVRTMPRAVYDRLSRGRATSGVVIVPVPFSLQAVRDDLGAGVSLELRRMDEPGHFSSVFPSPEPWRNLTALGGNCDCSVACKRPTAPSKNMRLCACRITASIR